MTTMTAELFPGTESWPREEFKRIDSKQEPGAQPSTESSRGADVQVTEGGMLESFDLDFEISLPAEPIERLAGPGAGEAMAELQRLLRNHDARVAGDLFDLALARRLTADIDTRALAVETLAAARVPVFEPAVVHLILELLESSEEELRFAAVAAATDLSSVGRYAVRGPIERLASRSEPSQDVRAAAQTFGRSDSRARGR